MERAGGPSPGLSHSEDAGPDTQGRPAGQGPVLLAAWLSDPGAEQARGPLRCSRRVVPGGERWPSDPLKVP